jgi:hypothetical protein
MLPTDQLETADLGRGAAAPVLDALDDRSISAAAARPR